VRRRFAALVLAVTLVLSLVPATEAQARPTWLRGYPEVGTSGCVEYVAAWSDGSFTSTPWACDSGVIARGPNGTASRGFPQTASNGCVEYVTQWSNGSFTVVPFSCPPGVTYFKPTGPTPTPTSRPCHPSYPTVCIPPPPPDLDCGDIPFRRFQVLPPDPHRFDGDRDGIGCE
jgi:hypothetical protein